MRDLGSVLGSQHLLLAETLGLAMARRAAEILDRHRAAMAGPARTGGAARTAAAGSAASGSAASGSAASGSAASGSAASGSAEDEQFAVDNAIFTAVLDAANECLGRFDARPADDRWCDALLQLIQLAQFAVDQDGPAGRVDAIGPISPISPIGPIGEASSVTG
jgi:hypothetical protein